MAEPAKKPAKKPTRPPDQVVRDIHAERAALTAAFTTLADELGRAVDRFVASRPVATTARAARTGARWAGALRRRAPQSS